MKQTTNKSILIIEDEAAIRDMVRYALESAQFDVLEAHDYQKARRILAEHLPNLILLDWMLPTTSGITITKQLRQDPLTKNIPIIMLTAKAEENNRVKGFEVGVDDYIVKPFSPRELIARIKAVLRRGVLTSLDEIIEVQSLKVDTANHKVYINEQEIDIGPTEYRLLVFFITHLDRVYSRSQILSHVWGQDTYIDERTVDVHIRRLRNALAPSQYDRYIQTVRGIGYRYVSEL